MNEMTREQALAFVLIPLRVGRLFGRGRSDQSDRIQLVLIPLRVGRLFGPRIPVMGPTVRTKVLIPLRVGRLFGLKSRPNTAGH